jgi:hypothetical protein
MFSIGIIVGSLLQGALFVLLSTTSQAPAWKRAMEQARRAARAGNSFALAGPSAVIVFYNNPRPFCYTYMIPGSWVAAGEEPNLYRSTDGRSLAGVLFRLPGELQGFEGTTMVERAKRFITQEHEKALGRKLSGVELAPFESVRPGTWKWTATPLMRGDQRIAFGTKIIVDLSPDAIAQITVSGRPDDDDMARRVIETLRTTKDAECYWPLLERVLKSMLGDR